MGDMHEAECQDELEKSPSCHRRDGQKILHPPVYPPPFTLPLLHARYFLAIIKSSSRQLSQNKVTILQSMWE